MYRTGPGCWYRRELWAALGCAGHHGAADSLAHRRILESGRCGGAAGGLPAGARHGAALAGGIGPALADLAAGYAAYVPATLVIKALMGLLAALGYRWARERAGIWTAACAVIAEMVMVAGYALYDGFLSGSLAVGMTGVPGNIVQGAFGAAASTLLCLARGAAVMSAGCFHGCEKHFETKKPSGAKLRAGRFFPCSMESEPSNKEEWPACLTVRPARQGSGGKRRRIWPLRTTSAGRNSRGR